MNDRFDVDGELLDALFKEAENQDRWWYLSFADDNGFRGAAVVKARGVVSASVRAHKLNINPGGEVLAFAVTTEFDETYADRLLSRPEIEEAFHCPAVKLGEIDEP